MGDGGDQEGPVEGALKRFVMVVSLYRYTAIKMNTPGSIIEARVRERVLIHNSPKPIAVIITGIFF